MVIARVLGCDEVGEMAEGAATNDSIIGRLLEEISWEGSRVRLYRRGGLGMENVLTVETLLPLSFLPRSHFLGEVLRAAHGAQGAREILASEIEQAEILVLPPELTLQPYGTIVQPDAVIQTASGYALVEAKRIRASSFQPEQLAREYLAVHRAAGPRLPTLLLILGAPPPVTVKKRGRRELAKAITDHLPSLLARSGRETESLIDLTNRIPEVVAWITWAEVAGVVSRQLSCIDIDDPSIRGTIDRLAASVSSAISRHA